MSERMTSASAPRHGVVGIAEWGRVTRPEMVSRFRASYAAQKAEAERAPVLPDDEIVVETYVGVNVQRRREVVR